MARLVAPAITMRPDGFSTELFDRYRRFEPAPVSTLSEIQVQGVSACKSKAIEERHCGRAEQSMAESRSSSIASPRIKVRIKVQGARNDGTPANLKSSRSKWRSLAE